MCGDDERTRIRARSIAYELRDCDPAEQSESEAALIK